MPCYDYEADAVYIRFHRVPPARSRFATAVFSYSITGSDGSAGCNKNRGCSIYCELDGQTLAPCPVNSITLKNLTENQDHHFLLNVTASNGERNSSSYKWFIDTIPPTASIITEKSYTNAETIAINVTFTEACTGLGGFKCMNSSTCDVMVNGPAGVDASSLRVIEHNVKYSLVIALSLKSTYGRVFIKMADKFCTDPAGNQFVRSNGSVVVVHFDRRPVGAEVWTSVPSYELELGGVLRTVIATNRAEDLEIFLDFSDCIVNSTEEILHVLHSNSGSFVPIHSKSHGNRQFIYKLQNISRTEIITVKLNSAALIGRSGSPVSPVTPVAFLYDATEPVVRLSTGSPRVTKKSNIDVIAEFTKPVFNFEASAVEVRGGKLTSFKEISKALYSLSILATSPNVVSVFVPEGKAKDITGNLNVASNRLEVRHYTTPAISVALHSFVTAGLLTTSLAACLLSLASANLGAIGALNSGTTTFIVSDPSMNLLGMVGHLQIFVFSDWLSFSLPIEYSETTKGLRWLIPREKLPWVKNSKSIWPSYDSTSEDLNKLPMKYRGMPEGPTLHERRAHNSTMLNSGNFSSYLQHGLALAPGIVPEAGGFHSQLNESKKSAFYGLPLSTDEYFVYFLKGEPTSAVNVINEIEIYTGWQDLEMNLFWLGVGGGGLVVAHFLVLLFLRWRTGTSVHGILSAPRFELFLLILMLPCISQSSAFAIRGKETKFIFNLVNHISEDFVNSVRYNVGCTGGTTGGIITGALLLAIPAALILSVCLFLVVAIFMGNFVQYKEVKHRDASKPWYAKVLIFLGGRPVTGKWFHLETVPSSFLPRFGFLFEDRKGPPVFVLLNVNDPNSMPKWVDSGQSGIGRMRAINSDDSNEEINTSTSERILGCARSAYIIFDLLRRVSVGIISGAYSTRGPSRSVIALAITLLQFVYLVTLKPYIRRGVHVVESVSLLCEIGVFGLSTYIDHLNLVEETRTTGFIMLAFLFISFVSQLVNEWHALIKCLLQIPQSRKPSFKLGLRCIAKGLILPFLPRKHWSRLVPGSSQPKTGLVTVLPLSPERQSERGDGRMPVVNPLGAMSATVVPVLSPSSPGLTNIQATSTVTAPSHIEKKSGEGKHLKGLKLESKGEMKKLRALAKASFSGGPKGGESSSSSYALRGKSVPDGASYISSRASSPDSRH
ncbi:PREDICTED: uncharacterized protein LOC104591726 isoform X2 [Nelumbo nucifera]|uniref:Uncharacterized protein LOC104591726 isoform X2 n=1 Tax=Nelumbo nucifera TaxID=4432 RepID=A0A1U7Z6T6_NELNU|nr:PREDICTED: uncharacterized protein LOC104591726 isoform X2 [Nelumbo nucifera]